MQPTTLPPPTGPFITAGISTLLSSVLLITLAAGLKLTLISVLSIIIPGMTLATMAIAISMGWIFISIGRNKRKPRWVAGTGILIAITMLQLLVLTYLTEGK